MSASPRASGEGWRPSKGGARWKIDGCIAMVIALDRAPTVSAAKTVASVILLSDFLDDDEW